MYKKEIRANDSSRHRLTVTLIMYGLLGQRFALSRIAIVIFSNRYTKSTWGLEELVKIKECMDEGKLVIIPIFYKVK